MVNTRYKLNRTYKAQGALTAALGWLSLAIPLWIDAKVLSVLVTMPIAKKLQSLTN